MSIRLRFTLLYNAILALTLLIFGVALYIVQAQTTLAVLKKELLRSSNTLGEAVLQATIHPETQKQTPASAAPPLALGARSQGAPPPHDAPPPQDAPPPKPPDSLSSDQAFLALPERELVRVLDASGKWVASPYGRPEDALPLNAQGLQAVTAHQEWWESAVVQAQSMLIYSRPIVAEGDGANGKVAYILQVARPLTERNNTLNTLAQTFVATSLVTLLLAFGVGWVLSGITLRPIQRMTQTVQLIGEERDFTRRVDYAGPPDEVGTLATTFNAMLTRLEAAYQQIARSLEMQRNFVADVSHELRTPLTTLRGNLALLRRHPPLPAEEQADILSDLVDECERLIRLVNELLMLARADAKRMFVQEPLALAPLLQEVCQQAQQLDATRCLRCITPPALELKGDKDALKQILLILLDNAVKHGKGDILVSAGARGQHVEIRVQDHGPGIPPETLAHLFDRFYRGSDSSHQGFGLGLAIAKTLVEAQQGAIRIESQVGVGSVVVLCFPA